MSIRKWITLTEAANTATLCLPMWAVDDQVLDRIEGLLMGMYEENVDPDDPNDGFGHEIAALLHDVQNMRSHIRYLAGENPPR